MASRPRNSIRRNARPRKAGPVRALVRGFWVVLAVLFLIEAWLWNHLEPVVERLAALFPWQGLKAALIRLITRLSPQATLIVFAIPFFLLMPVKFLEVRLIVTQQWIAAAVVLVLAKLVGVGLTAFIFETTKDKLLQMDWFRRVYEYFIWLRAWAHQNVDPIARRLRKWRRVLWHFHSGRFTVRLLRVRRRMRLAAAS
jgi:hypothetical protein